MRYEKRIKPKEILIKGQTKIEKNQKEKLGNGNRCFGDSKRRNQSFFCDASSIDVFLSGEKERKEKKAEKKEKRPKN